MFLHIGGDVVIPLKSVIAILDMDTTTVSKDSKSFIKIAEEEGFVIAIKNELPKSFVITEINKESRIYLSPISSVTLLKRTRDIQNFLMDNKTFIKEWSKKKWENQITMNLKYKY